MRNIQSAGTNCFLLTAFFFLLSGCGGGSLTGQSEASPEITSSGVRYHFYQKNKKARALQNGELVSFRMVVQNHQDSVLSDQLFQEYPFEKDYFIYKPYFKEIFSRVQEGDSLCFWINSDSLAAKPGFLTPPRIQANTDIKWTVKIHKILSKEEIRQKIEEDLKVTREVDEQLIQEYIGKLSENDTSIKFAHTDSGIYYYLQRAGRGLQPEMGDTVSIRYIGKLLNGRIYNQSDGNHEFFLGGFSPPGLNEGIALLQEGAKGTFIIPSELAYGEKGMRGVVPPNAIVVFDVELIEVK
ncbi:MAG: FKBP-type peptidyl-prolyl cis-trans isomerase [Bacteroidota bacterium]